MAPPHRRVFISYRREETAYAAAWLFNRLVDHFGKDQIFKDVDSIELGDDFVEVISDAVGSCDVLLALIGDRWLTTADDGGSRRLDNPDDFVRLEIEAALARKVRVVPILVAGAAMPRPDELPPTLVPLVRRQALELSPTRFDSDTARLVRALEKTLAEVQSRTAREAREADVQSTGREDPTRLPPRAGVQMQRGAREQTAPKAMAKVAPILRAQTEQGQQFDDPSEDLLFQLLGDIGRGDEQFVIVERLDDPSGETYAQVTLDDGRWVLEHRAGSADRHFMTTLADLPKAHEILVAWAFQVDGWDSRTAWDHVRF